MLTTSFRSLVLRRNAIEIVYLQFPWRTSHELVQAAGINQTEAFFQGFYSTLSHLVAVVRSYPEVFGKSLPHRSMAAFLKAWESRYPDDHEAVNLIEKAREHRAFLDHAPSLPAYGLHTYSSGPHELDIAYYGDFGASGTPPEGARTLPYFIDSQWHKFTPPYRLAFAALQLVAHQSFARIATHYGQPLFESPTADLDLSGYEDPDGDEAQFFEFEAGSVEEYKYDPDATEGRAIRALFDGTTTSVADRCLEQP